MLGGGRKTFRPKNPSLSKATPGPYTQQPLLVHNDQQPNLTPKNTHYILHSIPSSQTLLKLVCGSLGDQSPQVTKSCFFTGKRRFGACHSANVKNTPVLKPNLSIHREAREHKVDVPALRADVTDAVHIQLHICWL